MDLDVSPVIRKIFSCVSNRFEVNHKLKEYKKWQKFS